MTTVNQSNDDLRSPTLNIGRIVIGTGVAAGAALLGIYVGLPVIAATAVGAGIGGGAVAMMIANGAPLRR
jgi:hypothetical protein